MTSPPRVGFAETAFRWLMLAYPAAFRRAHGLALFELFRDDVRAADARTGRRGVARALARALVDTLANAPAVWMDRRAPAHPVAAAHASRGFAALFGGSLDDLRVAGRRLWTSPGYTMLAVATLAVGIGANTTVFSVVNAMLLRPLAARDPDRVVRVVARSGTGAAGAASRRFSYAELVDYRARATTLDELVGANLATMVLESDDRSDQILGEIASGGYLALLGARAQQGRLLGGADDSAGAPPVAMISDALWRRRFGGEPVVGRRILIDNRDYTIVGVADPAFLGSFVAAPVDAWVPIGSSGTMLGARWDVDRAQRTLMLIGRLRTGAGRERAQAELQSIATALARDFTPQLDPVIEVVPGTLVSGAQRRTLRMFLSLLLGLVGLVLVIACANVANLQLAGVLGRRRELAIRVALGASRWRLARLVALESVLLAAAGGAAALVVSSWTADLLANISPLPTLMLRLDVRPDLRVVAFTGAAALIAAGALAMLGALQAMATCIAPALHEDTGGLGGPTSTRLRSAMAALQIAVSLLLLVCAALFARSAERAGTVDLGFDPRNVVALDIDASSGRTNGQSRVFFENALRRIAAIPGVTAAAVSTRAPLDSSTPVVRVNGHEEVASAGEAASPSASVLVVSPGYFDVVRTPLVAGRAFTERDDERQPAVAIVNETLAARLWPDGGAIGRRLWLESAASPAPCLVVGIARDSKYVTIGEERQGHVYLAFAQQPRRGMTILVRASAPGARTIDAVQHVLRALDPNVQGFFARTLADHVAVSTLPLRLAVGVASAMAALALALAGLGLYGLVSFLVAERTHEIGVRMALGATQRQVRALVLGYGMKLAAIGLGVGLPLALAGTRLLRRLLFGVSATDPVVFSSVAVTVVAVALLACHLPARRAMRLDPIAAIRRS
jgi:putative ABC transport system permease protein